MKNFQKLSAIFLIAVFTIAVTACSNSAPQQTEDLTTTNESTNSSNNSANNSTTIEPNPKLETCKSIEDIAEKEECVKKIKDEEASSRAQIQQADLKKYDTATASGDRTKCQSILNSVLKQQCFTTVVQTAAIEARDSETCNDLTTEEEVSNCKRQVEIAVSSDQVDPNNSDSEKSFQ